MPMPLSQDYNEAIQNPQSSFSDPELKQGQAVTNALGLPVPCSGNFADVYALQTPRQKWAVKCFTREIPGIRERYQQVSSYLQQQPLPFMVEFKFIDQGIKVRNQWYPVLKMHWVEGFTLNQFVRDQLHNPPLIQTMCQIWVKLAARLKEANMAHCDLQHGNVMLVPSRQGALGVRLVDYDGMWVPALEFLKTIEVGHPNFQHPLRAKQGFYGVEVDRFSHLVIYTALRALQTAGKPLWTKFENGDNLLFRQQDLAAPGSSPVFAELGQHKDPEVRRLTHILAAAATKPINQTPVLSDLVPDTTQTKVVVPGNTAIHGPGRSQPARARKQSSGGVSMVGAAAVLALVAGLGVVGFFLLGGNGTSTSSSVAQAPSSTPVASTPTEPAPGDFKLDVPAKTQPETKPDVPKTEPGVKTEPEVVPPKNEPVTKTDPKDQPTTKVDPEPKAPVKIIPGTGGPLLRTLEVGGSPIRHLAISDDGRRALSYGPGGSFCFWDVEHGTLLRAMGRPNAVLQSAAVLPNDRILLQYDGRVDLLDMKSLAVREFSGVQGDATYAVAPASGNWILVMGSKVRQVDVANAQLISTSNLQNPPITRCALTPDGTHAVMLCGETVKYCKLADGLLLQQVASSQRGITDVLISPNGQSALLLNGTDAICWNLTTDTRIGLISGKGAPISSAAFTADGNHAILGLATGDIRILRLTSPGVLATLKGHTQAVRSVKLLPDGRTLWSTGDDQTMRCWTLPASVTQPAPAVVVKLPDPPPMVNPPVQPEPPKGPQRLPVPAADKLTALEKTVREVYSLSKIKPAERAAVAAKMLQAGQDSKIDVERYVLLREARDLAIQAGGVDTALQAVDKLDEFFVIDHLDMKSNTLIKLGPAQMPAAANKLLAEQCLETADTAVDADKYDLAISLLKLAEVAARRASNDPMAGQAKAQQKSVGEAQKEYEKLKPLIQILRNQPNDAAANLAVGRFLCFSKGQFDEGLPLLAKGNDAAVQALASKDLAKPTAAAAQVEVADLWFDLAEAESAAAKKQNLQRRALHWYQQVKGLAGLEQAKVEQRVKDLTAAVKPVSPADGNWLLIFRSVNPTHWNTNVRTRTEYAIPLNQVPDGVRYLRLRRGNDYVIIAMTKQRLNINSVDGKYGFEGSLHKDAPGAYHLGIYATDLQPAARGEVGISVDPKDFFRRSWYRGWGFGHFQLVNNGQAYSWNGQGVAQVAFEFAVKTGDLTDAETKRLLTAPAAPAAAP